MENNELPEEYETVNVTYKKDGNEITKKGFWNSLFDNFKMPNEWRDFNGSLLPHGFGADTRKKEEIIRWTKLS